jgi:D-alanyl-D-alanine carboxypeptidase
MIKVRGCGAVLALMLAAAGPAARYTLAAHPATQVTVGALAAHSVTRLDPEALQQAIAIQPEDHAAGVIARVRDGAQRWHGQVTDTVTGQPIPPDAHIRLGSITKHSMPPSPCN